ncbi:hypothetical protein [Nonomuraea sp. NPDC050540]|uniref:hypothetical protein n=1 Tax=Nonomuraea sp. NPDC050540 TaxID=3364367 RepID=UPI0037B7A6A0
MRFSAPIHWPGPRRTTRSAARLRRKTVQEVDRLGRNLLEGLIVLNDLFQQGIGVKVLEGIAAGEHTERSFILDLALAARGGSAHPSPTS